MMAVVFQNSKINAPTNQQPKPSSIIGNHDDIIEGDKANHELVGEKMKVV